MYCIYAEYNNLISWFMALVISFMWLTIKSISLIWFFFQDQVQLLLHSVMTISLILKHSSLSFWHSSLTDFPNFLFLEMTKHSPSLEPWRYLWLMTCLSLISQLSHWVLSVLPANIFSLSFSFCSHFYPLLSCYWSFHTNFSGSSLSCPCPLSHCPLLNLNKTLVSWKIPSG